MHWSGPGGGLGGLEMGPSGMRLSSSSLKLSSCLAFRTLGTLGTLVLKLSSSESWPSNSFCRSPDSSWTPRRLFAPLDHLATLSIVQLSSTEESQLVITRYFVDFGTSSRLTIDLLRRVGPESTSSDFQGLLRIRVLQSTKHLTIRQNWFCWTTRAGAEKTRGRCTFHCCLAIASYSFFCRWDIQTL